MSYNRNVEPHGRRAKRSPASKQRYHEARHWKRYKARLRRLGRVR